MVLTEVAVRLDRVPRGQVGVHVHGYHSGRGGADGGAADRAHNISSLGAGDVYVFNSNLLHEVGTVHGHRATFGTFVGYSPRELLVWA